MSRPLDDQRIVLGITGGIAAYKSADLVRRLRDSGADVRVVMTEAASRFITSTTLQALSGHPVRSSLWDEAAEAAMGHIELARWATRVVVAPASADALARLAHGHADDLLTTLCLATQAPLSLVPAMNQQMWRHPATQANIATLERRGATVIGPDSGDQACGETGPGRMAEPASIVARLSGGDAGTGELSGLRVLVSAGPTFEDIDPVRFIGNRSSGRMGFALATEAARMGAEVTLVAGPVALATPAGVVRIDVRSAAQMRDAILSAADHADVYVAAAAVADYRPSEVATEKIRKGPQTLTLALQANPDILSELARREPRPFLLGFAAETSALVENARRKLADKGLDMIAANRVGRPGAGFDADANELEVLWDGGGERIERGPKPIVARRLLEKLGERLREAAR